MSRKEEKKRTGGGGKKGLFAKHPKRNRVVDANGIGKIPFGKQTKQRKALDYDQNTRPRGKQKSFREREPRRGGG